MLSSFPILPIRPNHFYWPSMRDRSHAAYLHDYIGEGTSQQWRGDDVNVQVLANEFKIINLLGVQIQLNYIGHVLEYDK